MTAFRYILLFSLRLEPTPVTQSVWHGRKLMAVMAGSLASIFSLSPGSPPNYLGKHGLNDTLLLGQSPGSSSRPFLPPCPLERLPIMGILALALHPCKADPFPGQAINELRQSILAWSLAMSSPPRGSWGLPWRVWTQFSRHRESGGRRRREEEDEDG